ncbi:hypothetical protein EDD90_3651 [Streptomyces sp. Ag109_O5-1]|uniref:hypothetical protein n=1 Tax=Streptomyces sp. Ag109_O5-1 TaxID=1938851 RepID=UPI000F91D261|nr:hypothetical protein [Streptomyces sp. Ag109_O5-1]RPE40595.1 hypothetical protein EDD90_3651 [Streptomyces sp. Ag109_O5-1]
MRPGRPWAALLCAVAVLLLGGCGTVVAGQGGGATPTETGPVPWTDVAPSAVTGARLAADHRTLSLDAKVPIGPRPCYRDLKAVDTDAKYGAVPGAVHVQITYSTAYGDPSSGCTKEKTATTRVRLPEPLGGRKLVIDNSTVFTAEGAKPPALRLCGELGCNPPATGCTTASYDQAMIAVGAPMHSYPDAEHCDGKWLVLDFSWRTGPACGDDTKDSACTSRLGDRFFLRAERSGWQPFFESATGGCTAVQHRQPDFPTALCASLAPLSAALHPSYPPPSPSGSPATAR